MSDTASKKKPAVANVIPHLVVLVVCLLRYHMLLSGKFIFSSPLHRFHLEPLVWFFRDSVEFGRRIPLWNPYCYLGMPTLPGCMPGNYYPLNVLLLIRNYEVACVIFLVLHQLIAFSGALLVTRKIGFGLAKPWLKFVPAFVYLLIDISLVGDANLALAAGLAWAPWCAFGLIKCLGLEEVKPHRAGLVFINSVFLALVLVAGSVPLVVTVVVAFVSIIVGLYAVTGPGENRRPALVPYLVSIALSVGLAAPVVLPWCEWAGSSGNPVENIVRSEPACVSLDGVFRGPLTLTKEFEDDVLKRSGELIHSLIATAGHQSRYVVVLPEISNSRSDSDACYSTVADRNVRFKIVSPIGYLGHPEPGYRDIADGATGGNCMNGTFYPPGNMNAAWNLVRFCRLTSTAILVSVDWSKTGTNQFGFIDWRQMLITFKNETDQWHCFQQQVVTPVAYVIDNWHWAKNRKEVMETVFMRTPSKDEPASAEFDPRFLLLVEKGDRLEIDEDKLDKMPLTRAGAPIGPPMTDSAKRDTPANEPRAKPVEVMAYEAEHISLSVKADRPSFVVVTDTFYPGWKAYVDGVPAPCYRANGVGRAVFVTPGSHLVGFDFHPGSVNTGITVAISVFVVEILLAFVWLYRLLGRTVQFLSVGKWE